MCTIWGTPSQRTAVSITNNRIRRSRTSRDYPKGKDRAARFGIPKFSALRSSFCGGRVPSPPTLSLFPRQWMIKRPPCMQPRSSAPHVVGKEPAKLVLAPGRPGATLYQSVTPMYEAFDFYDRYRPTCRRQLQPQLLSPRPRPCLLSPPSMSSSRRRPRVSATMCSWHTLQPTLMILRSIQGRILIDTLRQLRRSTRAWACNRWWATPPHTYQCHH